MTPKDHRLVEAERKVERFAHEAELLKRSAEQNPSSKEIHQERDKARNKLQAARSTVEAVKATIGVERFNERLHGLHSEIEKLEVQMSEVALQGAEDPSNADLRRTLVDYRNERDAYKLQIEELHLARTAAANRDVAKEEQARKTRIAELLVQHKAAGAAAIKHSVDLVDYLAAAGPKFSAANRAIQDVISLNFAILRLVGGSKAMNTHSMSANAMSQPLVLGTVSALAATRIAQEGPTMAPYVSITTPLGPATGATQVEEQLRHQLQRHAETWAQYEPGFFEGTLDSSDFYDLRTPGMAGKKA